MQQKNAILLLSLGWLWLVFYKTMFFKHLSELRQ